MMINKDEGLERIIKNYEYVGLSVLVANKEEILYHVMDGVSDLETKKPITKDTVFRIASISKIEVALGIMKLVEEKKINIYDDISKYLGFKLRNPSYPNDIITIEMVMTQTSSISDAEDNGRGYDAVNCHKEDVDLERMLTDKNYKYYTDREFLNAKPGSVWQYSNFGCGILACIIERVSGVYYSDFLRDNIFLPLGLDASYRVDDIIKQDDVATLYDYYDHQFIKERDLKIFKEVLFPRYKLGNNFRGPAGGLFISVPDLAIIMQMLMNKGIYHGKRILKEETIKEMEQVHWQGHSYDPNYRAKGLQLNLMADFSKEILIGHTGSAYGLRSFLFYNTHFGYIFMCNGADFKNVENHLVKFEEDVLNYLINKYEN